MLVVVLGVFRGGVRLCSVSRLVGVVGRVQSVLIDVVRLVFCSFSVTLSMHFPHAMAFVGNILVLLFQASRGLGMAWDCLWWSGPPFIVVWFLACFHGEVGLERCSPS